MRARAPKEGNLQKPSGDHLSGMLKKGFSCAKKSLE